jgi:hypothetical protein
MGMRAARFLRVLVRRLPDLGATGVPGGRLLPAGDRHGPEHHLLGKHAAKELLNQGDLPIKRAIYKKASRKLEGEIDVCCHRVAWRFWGFKSEITDELKLHLETEAEERSQECIIKGFQSGQLCAYYTSEMDDDGEEIYGWWEIIRE